MDGGNGLGRGDIKSVDSQSHLLDDEKKNYHYHHHPYKRQFFRRARAGLVLGLVTAAMWFFLYSYFYPYGRYSILFHDPVDYFLANGAVDEATKTLGSMDKGVDKWRGILEKAATEDKTVIVTTINAAWTAPNSIFDLFLESFRIGNQTARLLNHLVVICMDQEAYDRCLAIHPHCYALGTNGKDFSGEAFFMSNNYLEMNWGRINLLGSILQLGYDFIFTDADIMWFRDPFPYFYPDGDFQISCDFYFSPSFMYNNPNNGFKYVKSNKQTINFYKFWYISRQSYPGCHEQDVLNKMRSYRSFDKIGIKLRFLDTAHFGGFCQPSKDLNQVCTMHANCCCGKDPKIHDLKVMLEDWRDFMLLSRDARILNPPSWRVPQNCGTKHCFKKEEERFA